MTSFRATATGPDRAQPLESMSMPPTPPPRQRRTDRTDDVAAISDGSTPGSAAGPLPVPAVRPNAAELIARLADMLAANLPAVDTQDAALLARELDERIIARIALCRDAVIASRLGGLQQDQRARLRAVGPAPGQLARQMAAELDQATLLALLNAPLPGPAAAAARLAGQLGRLKPALTEAALDGLHSPATLHRFDRLCRMHYARALAAALPMLALADSARDAVRQALALEEAEPQEGLQGGPPQHRGASEALLLDTLRRGDNRGAIQVLAAAALVPAASVEAAITLRSRRGMVALAWKAGYSMRAASLMQSQLADIAPDRVLVATADGSCPLSRGEILWQIGFLARRLG